MLVSVGIVGLNCGVDYDQDKVDEMVLALLFLGRHDGNRAWKSFDWGATERLHAKGMLDDPMGKAKSVSLTADGCQRCEELFRQY